MENPRCYLDISIGGQLEGRFVVELYKEIAPKTVENFRALCTGEKGIGPVTGVPLHYKGCRFHRVVSGYMLQGGDITAGDGTGGESIYGGNFDDENFSLKHNKPGLLSMGNSGPNTNGSRFSIVLTEAPHLDGSHVVFGRVIAGLGVIHAIQFVNITGDHHPVVDVVIAECGELPKGSDDGTLNFFNDGDFYAEWPCEHHEQRTDIEWWMTAASEIRAIGNEWFKKEDYRMAFRKYRKAMTYLDLSPKLEKKDAEKAVALAKLKSQIFVDSSACKFKLGDLTGALLDADYAIVEDPNNAIAFYREGQAYLAMTHYEFAMQSFNRAKTRAPRDGAIRKEIAVAIKRINERQDQMRQDFSRMFSGRYASTSGRS